MTDAPSFQGGPAARGRRDVLVVLAFVLVVAGVAVAIVKPWGDTRQPAASTKPALAAASPSAASATVPPDVLLTARPQQLPVAFTAPSPPGSSAWAGLSWQRLASDDPLGVVRTEVTAGGTSVAIGDIAGTTSTTVWSSTDRTHWQPLDSGTPTTFWPNLTIIGLTTLPGRFVAVSEMNDYLMQALPPVVAWASTDGLSWAPADTLPVDPRSIPAGSATLVAAGANGLVVATSGLDSRLATSSDGSSWIVSAGNAFPAGFVLDDLEGSASGYVAIGSWMKGDAPTRAAALFSADGRHWPKVPTLLPTVASRSGSPAVSTALTLSVGERGMIATGLGGSPSAALWWRSADGQRWQALPKFTPLGAANCGGSSCRLQPNGTLLGDGHRLVALRAGSDGTGWVSTDGERWARLSFAGDLPDAQARQATLLPGGVLLSDGTTTWFGQAEGD
jgi:hypothetical protein